MAPRFAPQSRMPTLLPQKTDVLWYPRERDVEHMEDELAQEEKDFTSKLKGIRFSGTHFIPAGLSKPFMDMEEEEEGEDDDDGDDEEEEEEDEDAEEEEGEDDLDMARDLDDEIGEEEEEEEEEEVEEDLNNRSMEFYHDGDMDLELRAGFDDGDGMMMGMGMLGHRTSTPDINELDDLDDAAANDLDHSRRIDQQSFHFSPRPTTRYHIGDDNDNDINNIHDEDGISRPMCHHHRLQEPYINQDDHLGGHHKDDQEGIDGWLQQQQQQLQEEEEEGYEEHDLDADIEVASSFGGGGDGGSDYGGGSDYDHDDDCRLYPSTPHQTPSPRNENK